jgi:hypothetical protein
MEEMQIRGSLLQGRGKKGVQTAIIHRKQVSCTSYLSFEASARL